ncbi:MAG: carbohydrate ABC transporter permease [Bacilli bacterium]|nr:carbohydrate ABC transporter permease [Bacilli bacterium]
MIKRLRVQSKTRPIQSHEKLWKQIIILTFVTFATAFSLLPLIITFLNSMKTNEQVAANIFALPEWNTMFVAIKDNFSVAWESIGPYFIKTIFIALITAVLETIIVVLLAYILTFKDFYFKNLVFMVFISILLVPSIIGYPILLPLIRDHMHLGKDNLYYIGYILPMLGGCQAPGMFLMRTFFSQQPKTLYESAKIEGANDFRLILHITIPLALPIILYYFVGAFSGVYNEYLWASLFLDGNYTTLMTKMYSLVDNQSIQYGGMYAMYIISSLPLIVTTIISMRYFKSGEFAAGLKL